MSRRVHRNKDKKIQEIKQAFLDLIMKNGYDAVTVRHIARKADVSVGLIYHYFPGGKPTVAAAIYRDSFQHITLNYTPTQDLAIVEAACRDHLDNHRKYVALYRVFDQARLNNQDTWRELREEQDRFYREYANSQGYPPELAKAWVLACGAVDAIIHRHLTIERLCDSDKDLIHLITVVYTSVLAKA